MKNQKIRNRWARWICGILITGGATFCLAQPGMRMRIHTANQAKPVQLVPATTHPPAKSEQAVDIVEDERRIEANGVPDHKVGAFPNRGNPNEIRAQSYLFKLPATPTQNRTATPMRGNHRGGGGFPFGVAVNGVLFDPATAEFWKADPQAGWNYEALGGAVPLGVDDNHAHVQPNGAYHYHGLPTLLLKKLGLKAEVHSPLVGWAADGFPIYARYGASDPDNAQSAIQDMKSSYRLKSGARPASPEGPGGSYDGAFNLDYEYVPGLGDLDECNGRFTRTPEYPNGTYAYFLTEDFPVVPRLFRGTPVNLRGEGGRHAQNGPPDGERRGPPPRGGPPPHGHRH